MKLSLAGQERVLLWSVESTIQKSSGDIKRAEFEAPEAGNLRVGAYLMAKLTRRIRENVCTQNQAAEELGITQPWLMNSRAGWPQIKQLILL